MSLDALPFVTVATFFALTIAFNVALPIVARRRARRGIHGSVSFVLLPQLALLGLAAFLADGATWPSTFEGVLLLGGVALALSFGWLLAAIAVSNRRARR